MGYDDDEEDETVAGAVAQTEIARAAVAAAAGEHLALIPFCLEQHCQLEPLLQRAQLLALVVPVAVPQQLLRRQVQERGQALLEQWRSPP
jgi:hypothetical protein